MASISSGQLSDLAKSRLKEAELLIENGLFQGAYYVSGYAAEFAFKAVVCKRLGIEVFSVKGVEGVSVVAKALQIHDLSALMLFSGLYPDQRVRKENDKEFFKAWNKVSEWSEQRRYEPLTCSDQTVKAFVKSVKIIMEWILSHY